MNYAKFFRIISSIKIDEDLDKKRGSEENIKVKIIIPFLQALGYEITKDMEFELDGADIILKNNEKLILKNNEKYLLIVETKSWNNPLNDLNQCLEYTLKLKTPFIMISSGQRTKIYSALLNPKDFKKTKPILEFTFYNLINNKSLFSEINSLIGKENMIRGSKLLYKKVRKQLPSNKSLRVAENEFQKKCSQYKPKNKTNKITEKKFKEIAKSHRPAIYKALMYARRQFNVLAHEPVSIRYRSKEIGLQYYDSKKLRNKYLGLIGIYPEKAKVAFSRDGWI